MKKGLFILGFMCALIIGAYVAQWNTAPGQFSAVKALSMPGTAVEGLDGVLNMSSVAEGQNVFSLNRNGQDTLESFSNTTNLKSGLYLFMIDTDDSSLVIPDADPFYLDSSFTLDGTDDKLLLYFDGSDWFSVGGIGNNE